MRDLVLQRTEAKDEGAGLMFKLNPKVDDIPQRFAVDADGVKLLVLGSVELGGKGCMCPESAVLKALMQHLLLRVDDDVILDMEAGLEHIGRASARGVEAMISVVEPGMRSVQTAARIHRLAKDIGIVRTFVVANKIRQANTSWTCSGRRSRDRSFSARFPTARNWPVPTSKVGRWAGKIACGPKWSGRSCRRCESRSIHRPRAFKPRRHDHNQARQQKRSKREQSYGKRQSPFGRSGHPGK